MLGKILVKILVSIMMLNLFGLVLDIAWSANRWTIDNGYFEYKISVLGDLPYWFLASIALIALNGIAISRLRGIGVFWGSGSVGVELPHVRYSVGISFSSLCYWCFLFSWSSFITDHIGLLMQ